MLYNIRSISEIYCSLYTGTICTFFNNWHTTVSYILVRSSPATIFDYDKFFGDKIEEKKADHSYRIFKKVSRMASKFPRAKEMTGGSKEITVFCSNDYLGMSWHPRVQSAVMYVYR